MSSVTHYLYTIHPSRPEMLTHGPTSEEAEIVAQLGIGTTTLYRKLKSYQMPQVRGHAK